MSHCGTEGYMAPEILNRDPYGFPVDWWSLGCLLHSMLVGEAPFCEKLPTKGKRGQVKSAKDRVKARLRLPNTLSVSCHRVLKALLEKAPADRLIDPQADERARDFFAGIDWGKLEAMELPPPLSVASTLQGDADLSNFFLEGLSGLPAGVSAEACCDRFPPLREMRDLQSELAALPEGKESKKQRQALRKAMHGLERSEPYLLALAAQQEEERLPDLPDFHFDPSAPQGVQQHGGAEQPAEEPALQCLGDTACEGDLHSAGVMKDTSNVTKSGDETGVGDGTADIQLRTADIQLGAGLSPAIRSNQSAEGEDGPEGKGFCQASGGAVAMEEPPRELSPRPWTWKLDGESSREETKRLRRTFFTLAIVTVRASSRRSLRAAWAYLFPESSYRACTTAEAARPRPDGLRIQRLAVKDPTSRAGRLSGA